MQKKKIRGFHDTGRRSSSIVAFKKNGDLENLLLTPARSKATSYELRADGRCTRVEAVVSCEVVSDCCGRGIY